MAAEPYGGHLVNRVIPERERERVLEEASRFPRLEMDMDTALDVENIATGVFSPLKGFMTKEELESVAHNMTLPDGLVWTIPILLQLPQRPQFQKGDRVALTFRGKVRAILEVKDIYTLDLLTIAKAVWGTDSTEHPGVNKFLSRGEWAVGGEIWLVEKMENPYSVWLLEPAETRKIFQYRGWKTVVGFQTRNAPHRGHEYLQRLGLEIADGLFINPVLGWKKSDDFDSLTVIKAYQLLINTYYPVDRVLLAGLATAMRYAGPREAVFHAIVRKNFGCTHFVVGRDHAGVGNFYGPYDAHRIFDRLPSSIGIEVIKVSDVFYCRKCEGMASSKSCGHSEEERIYVSMTKIRKMLAEGELPPEEMIRPDIARFLLRHYSYQGTSL
ncbi:sulfate adenylyltransferase [Thermocrinis albus DSM 14484]|uniref:Sulfate adenylyltransferase n=1 Tax=Thermocrinis albus (strain DSM 14484 / JCM 11386 / HI 11/12) TaxID=638303 RepID=D3SLW7_THEAH|nr:sulfate adenylyltransferase [Thermocrinis albus]ADC89747.1 sulfate adenylyltransferase [Thermocrinis albus DSM 14484]